MHARDLRKIIRDGKPLVVPGIYDGVSALLAEKLGFQALYVGSYGVSAAKYGLADIGYIGFNDMVDQVSRIASAIDLPLIVDAEGGFGNPVHVAQAVKRIEQAGAAALHIEDHVFGKHLTDRPQVLGLSPALDRIKAALDSRTSPDLMIIARTDCLGRFGADEAFARAVAFQEIGADAVFISGYGYAGEAPMPASRADIRVPLFNTDLPGRTVQDCLAYGVDVILYFGLPLMAAHHAMMNALKTLRDTGSSSELNLPTIFELDEFLGVSGVREQAMRYGLMDST